MFIKRLCRLVKRRPRSCFLCLVCPIWKKAWAMDWLCGFDCIFSCFEQFSAAIFFSTQVRRFWQTLDLAAKVVNRDTHWVTGTSVGWFSLVQGFWEASNQNPKHMPRKTAESIAEDCMGCSIESRYPAYLWLPFILNSDFQLKCETAKIHQETGMGGFNECYQRYTHTKMRG